MASARTVVNDTGAKSAEPNASAFAVVSGLGAKSAETNSSAFTVASEVGGKSAEAKASADTDEWWGKDAEMSAESKALWVAHHNGGKERQRKAEDALRKGKGMTGARARTAQFVKQ